MGLDTCHITLCCCVLWAIKFHKITLFIILILIQYIFEVYTYQIYRFFNPCNGLLKILIY